MATVFLAEDVRHRRKVAVKVVHPELAAVLGAERFLAEIHVTAALQHPHILPLFDSGQADGQLFYVMPYVEGESLRSRLHRERQLPINEAVRLSCEVASALERGRACCGTSSTRFSPGSNNSIDMILLWGVLVRQIFAIVHKCFYCRAVLVAT